MPLSTLSQFLVSLHDQLSLVFVPDTVDTLDQVLRTLAAQSVHLLRPPPSHRITTTAPLRPPGMPPTYFRMNERLDLVEVAPPLLTLLEITNPDDLLGDKWEQFLEPDELRRLMEMWMYAAQTRQGFMYMFRFTTPTGRQLTLRERVWPLKDSQTLAFHGWFGYVEAVSKVIHLTTPRRATPKGHQQSA